MKTWLAMLLLISTVQTHAITVKASSDVIKSERPNELAASKISTIVNDRFGFSITYRRDLFGFASDKSADGSGASASLSNGHAGFSAFGSFAYQTLEKSYAEELAEPGRIVTYKTINPGENFFVVSGFEKGAVFYNKTYVIDGLIKSMTVWYDAKLKAAYDKELASMSFYGFNPRLPADP